ncbi:MAG: hypothetical protein J6N49_05320 [Alphaproteobacteria bacterium]|nr:hypothetical protein [Alphaproteobacteria bacterium]
MEIEDIKKFDRDALIADAFKKATPVARKVAMYRMKTEGKDFTEIEDEFIDIIGIESRLYDSMKKSLVEHVQRHGLDIKSLDLFNEFVSQQYFDKNMINSVLRKVRRAYVQDQNNRNLEYLIAKLNEYLHKVDELGKTAYEMVMSGKNPDFDTWSDKVVMQDALFEENKQFLKQALHHLRTLQQNKVKLGVADIRMLMYHKDGCRREKLYHQVEEMIVDIYDNLDTEKERREIYPEICNFVAEIVPEVGYVSAQMVIFICARGFISESSRDLLIKIKPVVMRLGMYPLIITPFNHYYKTAVKNLSKGKLTPTDENVLAIIQTYKGLPDDVSASWQALKS